MEDKPNPLRKRSVAAQTPLIWRDPKAAKAAAPLDGLVSWKRTLASPHFPQRSPYSRITPIPVTATSAVAGLLP